MNVVERAIRDGSIDVTDARDITGMSYQWARLDQMYAELEAIADENLCRDDWPLAATEPADEQTA